MSEPLTTAIRRVIELNHDTLKHNALAMWTVYEKPDDWPDDYVARLFTVGAGKTTATEHLLAYDRLDILREVLSLSGLVRLSRQPEDDKKIVETWL